MLHQHTFLFLYNFSIIFHHIFCQHRYDFKCGIFLFLVFQIIRMLSTRKSLYSDDMTGHKTGTGLLFRPEAHDERMYATFLKQEVRYTRNIFQFAPCPWIIISNCDLFAVGLIFQI